MNPVTLWAAAAVTATLLAACDPYPVDHDEPCREWHEDAIQVIEQWFCFDDGDGYPTTYPGIYLDDYPTAAP